MTYHSIPWQTMTYHTIPCPTKPYHDLPCQTITHHAVPCQTIPCHTLPCHTMAPSCLQPAVELHIYGYFSPLPFNIRILSLTCYWGSTIRWVILIILSYWGGRKKTITHRYQILRIIIGEKGPANLVIGNPPSSPFAQCPKYIYRVVFFTGTPLKYGKPRLGESTLT